MCYVNKKAKEIGQEILNGNTDVNPFEKQKENACEYCPYRSVCGFDEKIPGYTYRRLHSYCEDEIWVFHGQKNREESLIQETAIFWSVQQQEVEKLRFLWKGFFS